LSLDNNHVPGEAWHLLLNDNCSLVVESLLITVSDDDYVLWLISLN